jgi:hypothetical protein
MSEEVFYVLLQDDEYRDISKSECSSESDMNVDILSSSEQSVNSDDVNVSGIQSGTWMKLGTFPFTGKSDLNVYTENTNNPLEYFWVVTSEIVKLISRDINWYVYQFLENTGNLN